MKDFTQDWYSKIMEIEGINPTPKKAPYAGQGSRLDGARLSAPSQPRPTQRAQQAQPVKRSLCNARQAPSTDFDYLLQVASKILVQISDRNDVDYTLAFQAVNQTERTAVKVVILLDAIMESGEVTVDYLRSKFPQPLLIAAACMQAPSDPEAINLYLSRIKSDALAKAGTLAFIKAGLADPQLSKTQKAFLALQRTILNS